MPHGPAALDPAAAPAPSPTARDSLSLARRIAALIRERRGTDLVLLDVRKLVDYTDFFLLASGQSSRQNQAIGEHVVKSLKAERHYAISKSGLDTGSWICLDMGDVVVHVFDPETRARYDLELLWADAPRVETEPRAEAAAAEGPAKRRRVVRKSAVAGADAANAPDSERPAEAEEDAFAGDAAPAPRRKVARTRRPDARRPAAKSPAKSAGKSAGRPQAKRGERLPASGKKGSGKGLGKAPRGKAPRKRPSR